MTVQLGIKKEDPVWPGCLSASQSYTSGCSMHIIGLVLGAEHLPKVTATMGVQITASDLLPFHTKSTVTGTWSL